MQHHIQTKTQFDFVKTKLKEREALMNNNYATGINPYLLNLSLTFFQTK